MKKPKTAKGAKPKKPADIHIVRAVTLPVGQVTSHTWQELNAALAKCFRAATDAANWCVMELFRRDTVGQSATPDAVKMGRTDKGQFYAYGEAGKCEFFKNWTGGKQSLNIVLQYAHREYLKRRFDVIVRHQQSLLTVRYPYPYPLDADAWKLSYADGGFPVVTCRVPGLDVPVVLRLKRRADFGRQLAMLKLVHDGTAKKGEAALYRNAKGDLLLKVVGKFPRREPCERTHACAIHTSPAALLVAEIDGRAPWVLNADHLKRWQAAHKTYRQRASEDGKREKRMDRRQCDHLNKARELRCDKHNNRLGTALHQITAQVARFCERNKVATVTYDDATKEYIPDGFPWHELKEKLRYKLDAMGVEWISGTETQATEAEEWSRRQVATGTATAENLMARRAMSNIRRAKPHPAVSPYPPKTSSGESARR